MRRSTREAKLKIVMKIMVFSGSVGPHPDCNFAFKFPINQSIFYRFPTVASNTLFNMYIHKLYTYFNFIAGINKPNLYMHTCADKCRYLQRDVGSIQGGCAASEAVNHQRSVPASISLLRELLQDPVTLADDAGTQI